MDVRADSDAARAGLRPGTSILAIDGLSTADAVAKLLGQAPDRSEPRARDWALRALLAGVHDTPRLLRVRVADSERLVQLPAADQFGGSAEQPLISRRLRPDVGFIRLQDSLGRDDTVAAFDRALQPLQDASALVIDLRDTASGGNTTVARGILGRFVDREMPYQKHVLSTEEARTGIRRSWLELVSPRGPFTYKGRVVVLVGYWTGSMGEGLALGFDATGRGTLVGTPMAGLLGATSRIHLAHTGIGINLPTEQLYHVDGTPREAFKPKRAVEPGSSTGDAALEAALQLLRD